MKNHPLDPRKTFHTRSTIVPCFIRGFPIGTILFLLFPLANCQLPTIFLLFVDLRAFYRIVNAFVAKIRRERCRSKKITMSILKIVQIGFASRFSRLLWDKLSQPLPAVEKGKRRKKCQEKVSGPKHFPVFTIFRI